MEALLKLQTASADIKHQTLLIYRVQTGKWGETINRRMKQDLRSVSRRRVDVK